MNTKPTIFARLSITAIFGGIAVVTRFIFSLVAPSTASVFSVTILLFISVLSKRNLDSLNQRACLVNKSKL